MNRRGFLGALLAGTVLDPERLLWVPGKKLISIPQPMLSVRLMRFVRLYDEFAAGDFIHRLDVTYGIRALGSSTKTGITAREAGIVIDQVQHWDYNAREMSRELVRRAMEEPGTIHAYQTLHLREGRNIVTMIESPVRFSYVPLAS